MSLARALKDEEPSCRIIYIGLKGDKLEGLAERYQIFDEVRYVTSGKFRRYHGESFLAHIVDVRTLALNIRDFFRVIIGIFKARRQLRLVKPDVVFCKGGFVAVPVGIAAHSKHIPIVTHDSDAIPGLANRIVGRWAAIHATGMPAELYTYPKDTIRYTGIPVDERIVPVTRQLQAQFKEELAVNSSDLVLLVGGAGLGSRDINDLILKIAPELLVRLTNLHIFHIAGGRHLKAVEDKYAASLAPGTRGRVTTLGFTDDFYKYTGAADLIISRAGATTIAELAAQQKATLLLPAAFLAGGHQAANAQVLQKNGAAVVLNDDVKPEQLLQEICALLEDDARRSELAAKLGAQAKPQAAQELAKLILSVVPRQGTADG